MSLDDYLINPRSVPSKAASIFGEWIAEQPIKTSQGIRYSTISLPLTWNQDYRRLKHRFQGKPVYKKV